MPLVTIWIDLEDIILNEISQMEKDKYFKLPHICAIKKNKANAKYNKTEADSSIVNKLWLIVGRGMWEGQDSGRV